MNSPRKTVPLASGDPPTRTRSYSNVTQLPETFRAFFCSVVFEGGNHGKPLPHSEQSHSRVITGLTDFPTTPDVQDMIASLGTRLNAEGKPNTNDAEESSELPSSSTEALLDQPVNVR